jgi:hypothetical protein
MAVFGIGRHFYFEARGVVSEPAGMAMSCFDRFLFRYVASAFMNVYGVGMMDAARFRIIERNDARRDHLGSATCIGDLSWFHCLSPYDTESQKKALNSPRAWAFHIRMFHSQRRNLLWPIDAAAAP